MPVANQQILFTLLFAFSGGISRPVFAVEKSNSQACATTLADSDKLKELKTRYAELVVRSSTVAESNGGSLILRVLMKQTEKALLDRGLTNDQVAQIAQTSADTETKVVIDQADIDFVDAIENWSELEDLMIDSSASILRRAEAAARIMFTENPTLPVNQVAHYSMELVRSKIKPQVTDSQLEKMLRYWSSHEETEFLQKEPLPFFALPVQLKYSKFKKAVKPGLFNSQPDGWHLVPDSEFKIGPNNFEERLRFDFVLGYWQEKLEVAYSQSRWLANYFAAEMAQQMGREDLAKQLLEFAAEAEKDPAIYGEQIEQAVRVYRKSLSYFLVPEDDRMREKLQSILRKRIRQMIDGANLRSDTREVFKEFDYDLDKIQNWVKAAVTGAEQDFRLPILVDLQRYVPPLSRVVAVVAPASLRKKVLIELGIGLESRVSDLWKRGHRASRQTSRMIISSSGPRFIVEVYRHQSHAYLELRVEDRNTGIVNSSDLREVPSITWDESGVLNQKGVAFEVAEPLSGGLALREILSMQLKPEQVEPYLNGESLNSESVKLIWKGPTDHRGIEGFLRDLPQMSDTSGIMSFDKHAGDYKHGILY